MPNRKIDAKIDDALASACATGDVPGIVAMATSDRHTLYAGAFGVRDFATGAAMTIDTVFRIASMTKAITATAAMQLVEQGRLALEEPLGRIMPELAAPQVLEGFDDGGRPLLRAARRPITLRHLLTHTAGFGYEAWNAEVGPYLRATGLPSPASGRLVALNQPLLFDPGERWQYGINIDWVGRVVETVSGEPLDRYFADHICGPLGMADTGFVPTPAQRARQTSAHQRGADGRLTPLPLEDPAAPREFFAGGGGLYSTGADYLAFLKMLLNGGTLGGAEILRPETVALMARNHIGALPAGILRSVQPERSNHVDFFPGQALRWGLAAMINAEPGPHGRSAGSLTWAGIFNSYFWLDPARRVAGLILMQILPFADPAALHAFAALERGVYDGLKGG
jgi:methyl acetate hydrolase